MENLLNNRMLIALILGAIAYLILALSFIRRGKILKDSTELSVKALEETKAYISEVTEILQSQEKELEDAKDVISILMKKLLISKICEKDCPAKKATPAKRKPGRPRKNK